MYKQLFGTTKDVRSMKILAELEGTPLKINIDIRAFNQPAIIGFLREGQIRFQGFSRRKSGYRWMGQICENKTGAIGAR